MSLETELIDVDYFADEFADVDAPNSHGSQLYDSTSGFDDSLVHEFASADCYIELNDSAVQPYGNQNPAECDGSAPHDQHPIPSADLNDQYQQFESSVVSTEPQFESADYSITLPDNLIQCHECFECFSDLDDFRAHIEYCIVDALEFAVQNTFNVVNESQVDELNAESTFVTSEDDLEMLEPPPVLEQMEPWPLQRESYVDPQPSSSSHFIASAVSSELAPSLGQFVYDRNLRPAYIEDDEFTQPMACDQFGQTANFSAPDLRAKTQEDESEVQFLDDGSCPTTHKEVFSQQIFDTDGRLSSIVSLQQPIAWTKANPLFWALPLRDSRTKRRLQYQNSPEPAVVIINLDKLNRPADLPSDSTSPAVDLSPSDLVEFNRSSVLSMSPIEGPRLRPLTKMTCPYCNVRIYRHNYGVHFRIHSGELPYQCFWCENRYRTSSGRKIHHRLHTGERPYRCKHCMYATTTKRNLDRHVFNAHRRFLDL